jgi:uncharacterized protein
VARREATNKSDVDMLVEFDSGASVFDQMALVADLEDLVGRRVEVTTPQGLHWMVRLQVLFEALPV